MGGLAFILVSVTSALNRLFTYNKLENLLVADLYKKPFTFRVRDQQTMSGTRMQTVDGDKKLNANE